MGPAPLEPIESAIALAPERRDVLGQEDEPERQHPEAEKRQDGEEAAKDEQHAGRNARPFRGGLSQPPGQGLHPARQPAEKPSQPPLGIGMGDIIGRGHGLRAQVPQIGRSAPACNPYFPPFRGQPESPSDPLDRLGRRVQRVDDRLDLLGRRGAAAQAQPKGGAQVKHRPPDRDESR